MSSQVWVTTFAVGQGLCELIEEWQDGNRDNLGYLALADCGSTGGRKKADIQGAFDNIIERARCRRGMTGSFYFDNVFISHQDLDHWNLFMPLLQQLLEVQPDGEYISAEDDEGVQTEFFVGENVNDELAVSSLTKDGMCRILSYSDKYENFDETELINYKSYERTWQYNEELTNKFDETVDISVYGEKESLEIKGKYDLQSDRIEISIKREWEDEEPGKEMSRKASIYTAAGGVHIWIENVKVGVYPEPERSLMGYLEAFLNVLREIWKNYEIAWGPLFMYIEGMIAINKGITEQTVCRNIKQARPVEKIINKVYFGGSDYGPSATRFKRRLEIYANEVADTNEIGKQDIFSDNRCVSLKLLELLCGSWKGAFSDENLYYHLTWEKVSLAVKRNRSSLMILLEDRDGSMAVLPGDATVHTMMAFVDINKKEKMVHGVKLLIAPHHGSDTTSENDPKLGYGKGYDQLREFLTLLHPIEIHISSGFQNRHYHPGKNFIGIAESVTADSAEHPLYQYDGKNDSAEMTTKGVYTTVGFNNEENEYTCEHRHFPLDVVAGARNTVLQAKSSDSPLVELCPAEIPAANLFV